MASEARSGLEERVAGALREAVREAYGLELNGVHVERPNEAVHGDFATNVALANARVFRRSPREVARNIVASLEAPFLESVEVAGPGFINFRLSSRALGEELEALLAAGEMYGRREASGEPVLLEYVSVNPTGPMTVAHGRHAAYGDSLVRIMGAAGRRVGGEYYFNDGGTRSGCSASPSPPATPNSLTGSGRSPTRRLSTAANTSARSPKTSKTGTSTVT